MVTGIKICRFIAIFLSLFPAFTVIALECNDCHEKYAKTSHGTLQCIDCHTDIKDFPHPDTVKKPECGSCHQDTARKYDASIHRGKKLDCKACHDVHNPSPVTKKCTACHVNPAHKDLPSAKMHLSALECTGCHARDARGQINVRITTERSIPRNMIDRDQNNFVDQKEWKDFLLQERSAGKATYKTKTTYSARGSAHDIGEKAQSCNACHVDNTIFPKAALTIKTAQQSMTLPLDPHGIIPRLPKNDLYSMTAHGKNGVSCRDCHVSSRRIKDAVCARCHQDIYSVYKSTKHAQGAAAQCTDCHDPHKVETYRELNSTERIAVCARCHGDYKKQHGWLPHAELHFMYLECSTCHSPRSEKGMAFHLAIRTPQGQRKLEYSDVIAAFGGTKKTKDYIDINGDWRVSSSELVPFLQTLERSKKGKVTVLSSILVTKIHHDYSEVKKRERICTTCHSNEAPFYQTMYLVLPEKNGVTRIPVKGSVLSAVPSSIAVNIFLLGETKIKLNDIRPLFAGPGEARRDAALELGFKWIDIAGIFVIGIIALSIIVHVFVRILSKR